MPTTQFTESSRSNENSFFLDEDTEISYLEHFAAPFTGAGSCIIPKGTLFSPQDLMNSDVLYLSTEYDEEIDTIIKRKIKEKYPNLLTRYQGATFYITEEQLRTLPLSFFTSYSCTLP